MSLKQISKPRGMALALQGTEREQQWQCHFQRSANSAREALLGNGAQSWAGMYWYQYPVQLGWYCLVQAGPSTPCTPDRADTALLLLKEQPTADLAVPFPSVKHLSLSRDVGRLNTPRITKPPQMCPQDPQAPPRCVPRNPKLPQMCAQEPQTPRCVPRNTELPGVSPGTPNPPRCVPREGLTPPAVSPGTPNSPDVSP